VARKATVAWAARARRHLPGADISSAPMASDLGGDGATGIATDARLGPRGAMLLAISNAVVRIYKQYFGKGPTKARAYYDGDVVTCVLSDVYTRAERTLLSRGRGALVLQQRHELQKAVREEFIAAIEDITERKVIGFFSGNQPDPDLSVEVFVLAPQDPR
jgi:uncharacterized protein YbcI